MDSDSIKAEIEDIITKGLRDDIYKSESAIFAFKTISTFAPSISTASDQIQSFFIYVQNLAFSEAILALSRIYDRLDKHPTRCILNLINKLKIASSCDLQITEPEQTIEQLKLCNFPEYLSQLVQDGKYGRFADCFAHHLIGKYYRTDFQAKLKELKDIRDKLLSHNERTPYEYYITWNNIYDLLAFAQRIVGIIGWAYFNTAYMFEGKYELTEGARSIESNIISVLEKLKIIEKG